MDATGKEILRAELLASGVIRYWGFIKSKDQLDHWLEVLGEALAELGESEAVIKIRANLLTYGLRVPEVRRSVHVDDQVVSQTLEAVSGSCDDEVCSRMSKDVTKGLPVHPSAASSIQPQQNPEPYEKTEVSRILTNIDLSENHSVPVHRAGLDGDKLEQNSVDGSNCDDRGFDKGSTLVDFVAEVKPALKGPTGSWTWRNWSYNRVPPAIEQAVYERFKQGWSKCKLAREFRLNRRTILRICRNFTGQNKGLECGLNPSEPR